MSAFKWPKGLGDAPEPQKFEPAKPKTEPKTEDQEKADKAAPKAEAKAPAPQK